MTDELEFDVLIVGAGLSGIGAAYHLTHTRPRARFVILESRQAIGGTWDLFRYPGIRSDSDLFTFSFDFKPWKSDTAIADGPSIKAYIEETARESGIDRHIRFGHRVLEARWSSAQARWSVLAERVETGERVTFTTRWIFGAAGYYRYDAGYTPEFPGRERFGGPVIHPQAWPEKLDYRGKRVVVIGSGATAITIVPAMADAAAHVTMLQRTPTYVLPVPTKDPIARGLQRVLGERLAHRATRRKNILQQRAVYALCQRYPSAARRLIRHVNKRLLPRDFDVDVHFNPPYAPWDQRLCAVTDGDLFHAIRRGKVSVVTDTIRTFTETGIELTSGEHLEADIVITATGLNLQALGGLQLYVDDAPVTFAEKVAFKGMMLSDVPNFAFAIGYTNSSWTLKVGLIAEHFCRLLAYMDERRFDVCVPAADPAMPTRPFLDFGAGYVQRALHALPRQGARAPWQTTMNYLVDEVLFRKGRVDDPDLRFRRVERPG